MLEVCFYYHGGFLCIETKKISVTDEYIKNDDVIIAEKFIDFEHSYNGDFVHQWRVNDTNFDYFTVEIKP